MRIKINDKVYRLKEIESGVDSLMELVEEPKYKDGDFVVNEAGDVLIFKEKVGGRIYDYAFLDEEKKCVEDTPRFRFKKGDKVRIKDGISRRTHHKISPYFLPEMDDLIGETMSVDSYTDDNYVKCEGICWSFHEEWLEPYEELKKGDLAIFWDNDDSDDSTIRLYDKKEYERHYDSYGIFWKNAIKFESKEQFERLLNGEL